MPIPTMFDKQLADVENAAAIVLLKLRVQHHGDPDDRNASARVLEALVAYNGVVKLAAGLVD